MLRRCFDQGSDADIDSRPAQKKGVMGLGDRLAAKAAAIAKTAGNALQTVRVRLCDVLWVGALCSGRSNIFVLFEK